jgi:D-xylose transport system permease protein
MTASAPNAEVSGGRRVAGRVAGRVANRWGAPAGLAIIWLVLALINPRFLSAVNLTNLVLQIVAVGTIAVGVVLVLLIGEIDLSVGAVSGFGAAVMAVASTRYGLAPALAILAGLAVGAFAGGVHGLLITRLRVPSLVVTLAGLLSWQGALLFVLGDTGTVNVTDPTLIAIAGSFVPPLLGWLLAFGVAGFAVVVLLQRWQRGDRAPTSLLPWVVAGLGAPVAMAVFNLDRGLPVVALLFLGLVVGFDVIVRRTRLGRHAIAIGSDATAARRAGIPVDRVRVTVFVLASMLAVTGGILAASRLLAVNQSSGSTDLMLGAIAAAVIGGTSLFGGRGSVWSALLGALVVGSVANGLDLLGVSSAARSLVTGLVLALAVGLDTVSRRSADAGAPTLAHR